MLIAQTPTPAPEGQPWWVTASLTAMGIIAGVITTIWARRGGNPDAPAPTPPVVQPDPGAPTTTIKLEPVPTTADGKLELAEKYVQLLERSQEELTVQAERLRTQVEELRTQVNQMRKAAEWAESQARERAETIAYLRALLDRAQVGPRPPPLRQEPPTDPTSPRGR